MKNQTYGLAEKNTNGVNQVDHVKNIVVCDYNKRYSIQSILVLFFLYSCTGWIYEVALYIVRGEGFVNRGMFHGPWLPIYGSGGVLMLVLLKRFREKPKLVFFMIMLLCGSIEYITSWFFEQSQGAKWWDYSDYYFNINGRVSLEGLLLFAVMGIISIYILSPRLDRWLIGINKNAIHRNVIFVLLIAISVVFMIDMVCSMMDPNMGNGISLVDLVVLTPY